MTDGPSRYAYVTNSPLMYIDPTGQEILWPSRGNKRLGGFIRGDFGFRLDYHRNPYTTSLHFHAGNKRSKHWGGHRPWHSPWRKF